MAESKTPWLRNYPNDVPDTVDPKLYENLNDFFTDTCKKYAERRAFMSFGSSISYSDFSSYVDALSAFLQCSLGAKKGDRVALILPNIIQYPICVFSVLKCGMEVVNINPLYTSHEMLGVLRDSKARFLISFEKCNATVLSIIDQTYVECCISCSLGDCMSFFKGAFYNFALRHIKKEIPFYNKSRFLKFSDCIDKGIKRKQDFQTVEMLFDDIAFLQYTGGTTGKPKGAMLSHGNIISNVAQAYAMYGPRLHKGNETILTALPLYHVFAMTVNLMFAMFIGCTNLLIIDPRRFPSLEKELFRNPDISIITGVNTLFNAFVNNNTFKKLKLPNLRIVIGGGTAVQHGVADNFLKDSGIPILEGYGLTECSPLCCVVPYNVTEFTGTIGVPTPSTLARIVDTKTGEEIWEPGLSGELEFKGPQVMKGYFSNEVETNAVFDKGWLKTGDIAEWTDNWHIKVIDRLKDMIIVSGFNVFPNEIENVLSHNNKIAECAVVGVPSNTTGESIKVYIVRKDPSLTKDDVINFCKEYLTGYKMPKHIEFVDTLPKSAVGKVMRRYLRENRIS